MKHFKRLLTAFALFVAIGIPQCVMAQPLGAYSVLKPERSQVGEETQNKWREMYRKGGDKFLKSFVVELYKIAPKIDTLEVLDLFGITREEFERIIGPNIFNVVGKWINKANSNQKIEFKIDKTYTFQTATNRTYTIPGSDIIFPSVSRTYWGTWNVEGNALTIIESQIDIVLGDISYYPAEDQQRIKDYVRELENNYNETSHYILTSTSPTSIDYKDANDGTYAYLRDVESLTAQEKIEYDKEVERLEQEKKEELLLAKKRAQQHDDRVMAPLKAKAIGSGQQYDYWIIGHTYEFGEGNDFVKVTINLDSALVWYKKAAAIDPANERYVTALSHKMKTGGDFYEDKAKETIANAKKKAASLGSKYGAAYVNSLINTGNIKVGTPMALLQEYIPIKNPLMAHKNYYAEIKYYEPSIRDMTQYGKAAKRVKIINSWGNVYYSLMVVNGKVVAVYQQGLALKIE